jgi:hypothetical protein
MESCPPEWVKPHGSGLMDYYKIISELYTEKQRLDRVIRELELLHDGQPDAGTSPLVRSRRGRKSMGEKEREEVSRRMKKYWADRRKKQSD